MPDDQAPKIASEKIETSTSITPELLAEFRKRFPEQCAGTPEWQLKVRLEAASKMYDETGLILWE